MLRILATPRDGFDCAEKVTEDTPAGSSSLPIVAVLYTPQPPVEGTRQTTCDFPLRTCNGVSALSGRQE